MSWPVPLWCRVESTGPVSRFGAAGAAPLLDAHFQHLGCIRPQSFWTNCEWTCQKQRLHTRLHTSSKWSFLKSMSEQCHCLGRIVLTSLLSLCPTRQQFWHEAVLPVHKTWRPCTLNFITVIRIKQVALDFWARFKTHIVLGLWHPPFGGWEWHYLSTEGWQSGCSSWGNR